MLRGIDWSRIERLMHEMQRRAARVSKMPPATEPWVLRDHAVVTKALRNLETMRPMIEKQRREAERIMNSPSMQQARKHLAALAKGL